MLTWFNFISLWAFWKPYFLTQIVHQSWSDPKNHTWSVNLHKYCHSLVQDQFYICTLCFIEVNTYNIISENRRICVNNFKILKQEIGSAIVYFHIAKLWNEENLSNSRHQKTLHFIARVSKNMHWYLLLSYVYFNLTSSNLCSDHLLYAANNQVLNHSYFPYWVNLLVVCKVWNQGHFIINLQQNWKDKRLKRM